MLLGALVLALLLLPPAPFALSSVEVVKFEPKELKESMEVEEEELLAVGLLFC